MEHDQVVEEIGMIKGQLLGIKIIFGLLIAIVFTLSGIAMSSSNVAKEKADKANENAQSAIHLAKQPDLELHIIIARIETQIQEINKKLDKD